MDDIGFQCAVYMLDLGKILLPQKKLQKILATTARIGEAELADTLIGISVKPFHTFGPSKYLLFFESRCGDPVSWCAGLPRKIWQRWAE